MAVAAARAPEADARAVLAAKLIVFYETATEPQTARHTQSKAKLQLKKLLSSIWGLVTVAVRPRGCKVVLPSRSKGVPLEATKICFFK